MQIGYDGLWMKLLMLCFHICFIWVSLNYENYVKGKFVVKEYHTPAQRFKFPAFVFYLMDYEQVWYVLKLGTNLGFSFILVWIISCIIFHWDILHTVRRMLGALHSYMSWMGVCKLVLHILTLQSPSNPKWLGATHSIGGKK